MKKYSGVALHVIVFVFLFIFLRIFSEYHFYCVEQNQLFQLTPIFIIDKLMQPGGLAMVLSGCLVQFFILPNVGAMITAALLTGLGALFWAILRRIDPRSHGILWAWLPVLSLLFVQWDFNYSFIYTGERYMLGNNTPVNYIQPWYTHDMSLSRNFPFKHAQLRITAEVNNIFNQQYEVVKWYPMPGTNFKIILSLTL